MIFILMLFYSANVFCQRGTTVGVDGSFNSTWIAYPNAYGVEDFDNTKLKYYKPSYGDDFSLSIGQNFVDVLGIKAEIGYSTQNQDYDNSKANSTRDLKLNYFQIPVMLRLSTHGQHVMYHLMFGPQFGILSSAKQTNVTDKGKDTTVTNYANVVVYKPGMNSITDRYNKLDILGVVDLGCDIYLTDKLLLNVGIRLHASFKDINSSDWQYQNSPGFSYSASRNLYGGINVGLTYALKNWYNMK